MVRYNPEKHHRRSIHLQSYDYASPGAYFITMCIQNRLHLLGEVVDGQMICNEAGNMVSRWWEKLPTKFTNVTLGEYVIMPNHFHGIIHITKPNPINTTVGAPPTVGATQRGRPSSSQPETTTDVGNNFQTSSNANGGQPHGAAPTGNETSTGNPTGNETPTRNSTQNEIPTGNSAQSENPTVTDNVTLGEIIGWFKTMTTNEYIRGVKQLSWQPFNKHFWQRNYFERIVRDDKSLNAITHYIFNNPKHWGSDSENTFR